MIQTQAQTRDQKTGAILSKDVAALNKYKSERALYRKVASLTKELEQVKECVARLSNRLDQIENN